MTQLILIGLGVVFFFVLWFRSRGALASLVFILGTLTVAPVLIGQLSGESSINGTLATPSVSVYTYHLALLLAMLAVGGVLSPKNTPISLLILAPVFLVLAVAQDQLEPHILAGVIQLAFAALAFGVGSGIGRVRHSGGVSDREIAVVLFIMVLAQAVAVVLELLGYRTVSTVEVGDDQFARFQGLAGVSGNLGKILTLFLVLWLPLTQSQDRLTRRLTYLGLGASAVMVGLSLSRANTVAFFLAIGIWFVLAGGGKKLSRRVLIPIVFLFVSLPFLEVLLLRQAFDPEGASRPQLLTTAIELIGAHPWIGVGPNNYLVEAGQIDPLAAGGLPVHSAIVLLLAELGILGAVMIGIPLTRLVIGALRKRRQEGPEGLIALATCAVLPGVLLIAATGWGLAARTMLLLLFFVAGFAASAVSSRSSAQIGSIERSGIDARILSSSPGSSRASLPTSARSSTGRSTNFRPS